MEEEGEGEGVLNILIGGNPSESSELFRCLGRELGGMGGTGYSGMAIRGGLGVFILEGSFAKSVLLCLAASQFCRVVCIGINRDRIG